MHHVAQVGQDVRHLVTESFQCGVFRNRQGFRSHAPEFSTGFSCPVAACEGYHERMTETKPDAPPASANGAAPAPEEPCEDCATSGEKALAAVAFAFGLFVIAMAIDMFTGGALGRAVNRMREPAGD